MTPTIASPALTEPQCHYHPQVRPGVGLQKLHSLAQAKGQWSSSTDWPDSGPTAQHCQREAEPRLTPRAANTQGSATTQKNRRGQEGPGKGYLWRTVFPEAPPEV